MKHLKFKVFTAFSGYDSQCMALDKLSENFPFFNYELVGWSEIDKYAIQAHNAVYPWLANRNYGDISKINWEEVPDFDLFTMSSPCQDFSSAGLQKGGVEGSGTRSSLLWECRRAILAKKPKYILFENVKNLVSKKFLPYFQKWQKELESYGYTNFAKVVNAKDYGIPQNRERIFMISILDTNELYSFPKPIPLQKRLKDVLEEEVDEKYYLSQYTSNIFQSYKKQAKELCDKPIIIDDYNQRIPKDQDIIGTITTNIGNSAPRNGYKIVEPDWKTIVGNKQMNPFRVNIEGVSPCITSSCGAGGRMTPMITNAELETTKTKEFIEQIRGHQQMDYRIRKLTPKECFRLMGVSETNIDKIQGSGISDSQQYKMAGNSIVVDTLYHLMRKLFVETANEGDSLF